MTRVTFCFLTHHFHLLLRRFTTGYLAREVVSPCFIGDKSPGRQTCCPHSMGGSYVESCSQPVSPRCGRNFPLPSVSRKPLVGPPFYKHAFYPPVRVASSTRGIRGRGRFTVATSGRIKDGLQQKISASTFLQGGAGRFHSLAAGYEKQQH